MRLKERKIAFPEVNDESAAYESAFYLQRTGFELVRIRVLEIRSDIYDHCTISYSYDNGHTWSEPEPFQVSRKTPQGVYYKDYGTPFADPVNGRLISFVSQSFLPNDEMLEALTHSYLMYRVSEDGGKTWIVDEQIMQNDERAGYTSGHPFEGLWVGKNAMHMSNVTFRSSAGKIILPVQLTKLGPDGKLFCPPGALSYHEMMLLIGTWTDDGRIIWDTSPRITIEPEMSTRGACEGAVAEMPDGRMLMVIRTSNDGHLELPGHKWYCISKDGGYTWDKPRPWGYSDGSLFYSPSSYSTILKHTNGKYYWFGNICPENPVGNLPRYPVVVGEIDPYGLLLEKKSLFEIDTRREDEDDCPPRNGPYLSNFGVYEDRENGDMVMRMTRMWVTQKQVIRGHSYLYRIEP